jgi:hypothetical protein
VPSKMRLRARRTIGGLLRGVFYEVMGHKNFTISELNDRGGSQKTITPSSLRCENQIEVRLPLATLRVGLRNQILIARRPHPNVDVGWPAAVGDGHVALEAIPSSFAGKHASLRVTVGLSHGIQRTTHQGPTPPSRPNPRSSMPSLSRCLNTGCSWPSRTRSSSTKVF